MTDTSATDTAVFQTDIVIFGAGIAGLWLLNKLQSCGYSTLLLESTALGHGQSIASQGIIHGGLKYALAGGLSGAAEAITAMPARWRDCLAGDDPVDLSGCRLLSEHCYMWSEGSFRSRLKTFLGSRMLQGRIELVKDEEYPPGLQPARGQGSLYRLPDFVVDTRSLLETLAGPHHDRIYRIDPAGLAFKKNGSGDITTLQVNKGNKVLEIRAQRYIFCAGEGNPSLQKLAGLDRPAMQVRPLNMVILRQSSLPSLFVHCIGDDFSLSPRLTLTSHVSATGQRAWYLGGELAESGVRRNDSEQVTEASNLLAQLFPWLDLAGGDWACLRINRAEGLEKGRHRPDSVFFEAEGNFITAWPTKFTLSPVLADDISEELNNQAVIPGEFTEPGDLSVYLPEVKLAMPPWEACFDNA